MEHWEMQLGNGTKVTSRSELFLTVESTNALDAEQLQLIYDYGYKISDLPLIIENRTVDHFTNEVIEKKIYTFINLNGYP